MTRLALAGFVAAAVGAYAPSVHAQRGGGGPIPHRGGGGYAPPSRSSSTSTTIRGAGRPSAEHRGGGGYAPSSRTSTRSSAPGGGGGRPSAGLRGAGGYVPGSGTTPPSSAFNRTPTFTPGLARRPAPAFVAPGAFRPQAPAVATGLAPAAPPPAWASRPGWSEHQDWIHGYWHGRNAAGAGWGLNPAIHDWGYRAFANPYAAAAEQEVHDYSKPLSAVPPAAADVERALTTFDAARVAFRAGDYASALKQADAALKITPDDAAIHEFRALCLFALQMYDQAAATLYAVLAAGPGWDWTTLARLYPDIDAYSAQLQALEAYRTANPNSAAARFLLGTHYLTENFTRSAAREFAKAAELQPADALSRRIVANLTGNSERTPPAAATTDEPSVTGTWKAAADAATTIELTLKDDGGFVWNIVRNGEVQPITGDYAHADGVLTLVRTGAEVDSLVGRLTWNGPSRFVLQALGGGDADPGLDFSKSAPE